MDDVELNICPRSFITPLSRELVTVITRAGHANAASGASFGGSDSSKWPAWWFDSVVAIQQQDIAVHNARVAAEIAHAKSRH